MTLPKLPLSLSLCLAAFSAIHADVKLPAIFGDHMVLQHGKPATLWGWADPQEKVSIQFGGKTAQAVTGANGKWTLKLDLPAEAGPFDMTVTGKNTPKIFAVSKFPARIVFWNVTTPSPPGKLTTPPPFPVPSRFLSD